jgi:polyisoprenyl-teichoic acid--peptidoglycan teichoic acid transferase
MHRRLVCTVASSYVEDNHMNCAEARRLLDRGIRPSSSTPERAQLGFHLSSCPACRAHQEALQDKLLADLLLQAGSPRPGDSAQKPARLPPAVAAPQPAAPPPASRRPVRQWMGRVVWYGGLAALIVLVLIAGSITGWAALSVFSIHSNVQAMIVPTETPAVPATSLVEASVTASPTQQPTALPTATLRPTSTPLPTAPPPTPTPAPPDAGGPTTILLLGSDRRPGESDPSRTDAIVIARIDPDRGRVALLSLPRDLWVEIPGYGASRINAAHVWGQIYGDPEGGVGLARRTVSNLLGIPIDYTVLIDFEGFIGAIDAMGGIDVDVTKELYDDQFPTMDYGYTVAHFLPGRQHMDGTTALMYSRIRHPDSDFERMRRQQAVLVGILDRLRQHNALQGLRSIEDATAALRGYVRMDIPEQRLFGLAWAMRDVTPERVEHLIVDENMISFGIGGDRWAEVAQPGAIEALVQQLLGQ